jgi:hypothetical protein
VGGRQAATLLHKAAWWAGGSFLFLCFVLSIIGSRGTAPRSLVEQEMRRTQSQEAPAPLAPLPLEQTAPAQQPSGSAKTPATPAQPPR